MKIITKTYKDANSTSPPEANSRELQGRTIIIRFITSRMMIKFVGVGVIRLKFSYVRSIFWLIFWLSGRMSQVG